MFTVEFHLFTQLTFVIKDLLLTGMAVIDTAELK